MAAVEDDCRAANVDGLEVIWDHMPYTEEMPPNYLVVGYHLMFWSNWLDYWRGDEAALLREFGDWDMIREYYHGTTRESMVAQYKTDLRRAIDLDAEYVVFHVSEVSLKECFTYRFAYSDEEVCDAAAELINQILDGEDIRMALLVENQWWPGLTFTRPAVTERLLAGIEYDNKGVMLDTGHLLHTNTSLRTQEQAARYVHDMWEAHGKLRDCVRGLHLHQSLSGEYVEQSGFKVPDDLKEGYWDQYSQCYNHILQIDRHQPWTDPAIAPVVAAIDPEWVNNELSAWPREAHKQAVATQMATLAQGGLVHTSALGA